MKKLLSLALACVCCLGCVLMLASCDNQPENVESDIYYFEYKNTKLELGADAKGVLEALGDTKYEPMSVADCANGGVQWKYVYDDFTLTTVKNGDKETIDSIEFTNDIPETSKGICLGASSDKIIQSYGEPTEKNDERQMIKYEELHSGKEYKKLIFYYKEGKVSSITYKIGENS